ncbi:MAG TPA: FkbM family methyltransferase [Candidatus Faecisoma merdavium]|nr:FkbM family methyltransferase [Candidatus Faecisoma merdavium]
MNIIDKNFNDFVLKIKNMNLEEIFLNIKNNFNKVHPDTQKSIQKFLNDFNYWGTLDIEKNDYNEIYEKAKSFYEHIDDYIWLYNNLKDYTSKKILFAILNNWYQYDFSTLKECMNYNYKHYFDLDVIPNCDNQVFVDVGTYIGDTTLDYIKIYNNYKKIYCYEITNYTMAILKNNLGEYKNIVYKNKAVSCENSIMYLKNSLVNSSANQVDNNGEIEIETVSLDNDILEKIDMIKMDIEGSEYNALIGAKNHIINDKPILLISVYHNNEDLWKLPKLIYEYNNNYNFYLRYYGNNIFPTEIVLFAIPK